MKNKPLLIFDLDETLVHASKVELAELADFQFSNYFVYKRPGLDAFLSHCANHFQLAIWSSADEEYVQEIVNNLKTDKTIFAFIWSRDHCSLKVDTPQQLNSDYAGRYSERKWIKPLKKVEKISFNLDSVLIIDDSPHKVSENKENALIIDSYNGNPSDRSLAALQQFLDNYINVNDVRLVNKKYWAIK